MTELKKNRIAKCLAIGINYKHDPKYKLQGCYNDVISITRVIAKYFKCKPSNILRLIDEDIKHKPTKNNIILGIKWLLCSRCDINEMLTCGHNYPHKPNTIIAFHYSGHGSQVSDKSHDEYDNMDECLVPLDFLKNGYITDDYLYEVLVSRIPKNVTLYATMDMCNSETSLDLKYTENANRKVISTRRQDAVGNVVQISTSLDGKSSADMKFNNKFFGAGTKVLLEVLAEHKYNITGQNLVYFMNEKLKLVYDQQARLSYSSIAYDENKYFFK